MSHGKWEFEDELEDDWQAFEQRRSLKAQMDDSRYCYFDCGRAPSSWIQRDREMGGMRHDGYAWTVKEEGVGERKVELMYPDCLEEDQRALEQLLMGLQKESN